MSAHSHPQGRAPTNCYARSGSPFWQYDFQIRGRRERGSTGTSNAGEARAYVEKRKVALRKAIAAEEAGAKVPKAKFRPTLADAIARYRQDKHPQRPEDEGNWPMRSWRAEAHKATLLAAILGADKRLRDLEPSDWVNYRTTRRQITSRHHKPPAGSTINREIQLARRIYRHVMSLGWDVGVEPRWRDFVDQGAEVARKGEISAADEERLFAALAARNHEVALVAEFALLSGQRKTEVCLLRRSKVDLIGRRATIKLKRKGVPTDHSFPLTDRMIEIVSSFPVLPGIDQVFSYECRRSRPERKRLPERIKGERYPFTRDGWRRHWDKALEDAGLTDVRWHDLRHTAATRLVRAVPNLALAQKLLGHSDITTTARYAHAADEDVRAAMIAAQAVRKAPPEAEREAA